MTNKLWLAIFALWAVFLTGAFGNLVGSPGVLQAVRLNELLRSKQAQLQGLEADIKQLEAERQRLEKSRVAQEREIRRSLGYAAPDELIFDFTAAERLGG